MSSSTRFPFLAALALACATSTLPAQSRLLAVDGGTLVELDPATGLVIASIPLSGSPGTVGGLAYDPATDTLFLSSTGNDNLWTLDYNTGVVTLVGLFNVGTGVVMHGLEVDDTGQLYGYSTNATSSARFFSIDRTTGQATPISDPGFGGFGSLGFVPATGTMYVADTVGDQLLTIDRATGVTSVVGPFNGASTQIGVGLAYDTTLGMYAVNNSGTDTLWTIDLATGAATLVGNMTTSNVLGMAFLPPAGTQPVAFCFGDGAAVPCPCANSGAAGSGCANSANPNGAGLSWSGQANVASDTLVLTSSGELNSSLSIFLQGNAQIAPIAFGDGLRCAGGQLKRLYVKSAVAGVATAPVGADPSVTQQSAALGDPLVAGAVRVMQVYYRDANAGFCPAPAGSTYNISGAVLVTWN